jgi:phosphorylase/glycogen(starch) synthase
MYVRQKMLAENGFEKAYELTAWKRRVLRVWDFITLVNIEVPNPSMDTALKLGERYSVGLTIDLKDLSTSDVGVEIIFGDKRDNKIDRILDVVELKPIKEEGGIAQYKAEIDAVSTGSFEIAFRIFPKNPMLPHRQDFNLVRWM